MRGASLLKWKMRRPKHRKLSWRIAVMKFERASSTPGVHECQQWRRLACGQRAALARRILGDLRRRGAEAGLLTPLISATAPQDMEPGLRPTLHERLPII